MLKNALFFALAALVIGVSAPSWFPQGARVVATAPAVRDVAAPLAPAPAPPAEAAASGDSGFREASIPADAAGQFRASALIEGSPVDMMIDTGATVVAISAETAARIGIAPNPAAPKWRMNTANGVADVSPVSLRRISLGSIEMFDVQAVVMPSDAGTANLLGASFLKRLASVEQRDGVLLLKQ
jgi:aspartyl protease family protein